MNLLPLPTQYYSAGRSQPIRYIVIHSTEGYDSRRELTVVGRASAHYLVREEATYVIVMEGDRAWHAGVVAGVPTTPLYTGINPNEESIGIEMEGFAAREISPKIINDTAELVLNIRRRRGPLPLVSHSELSPARRTDPGIHNRRALERAIKAMEEENVLTGEQVKEIIREMATSPEGALLVRHALTASSDHPDTTISDQLKESEEKTRKWIVGIK